MRPIDFDAYVEAQEIVYERQMNQLAWHAVNTMNATGNFKQPLTIDDVLPDIKKKKTQTSQKSQKKKISDDAALKELFTRIG